MQSILASDYVDIPNRGEDIEKVSRELENAINGINRCQVQFVVMLTNWPLSATPARIHPTERERFLDALLFDLEDKEGSRWSAWPEDGASPSGRNS